MRIVVALALLALGSVSAVAADVAVEEIYQPPARLVVPPFNWTGVYIGAHGGYGSGRNSVPGSGSIGNITGGFGGGQVGFNYQTLFGWVYGIEVDGSISGIQRTDSIAVNGVTLSFNQSLDGFGTARGRVGYAFDTVMPYLTGGVAFGRGSGTASAAVPGIVVSGNSTNNLTGYALGGGLEWAFTREWTVKGEYLYLDFGSQNYFGNLPVSTNVNTFKIGLNYLFH